MATLARVLVGANERGGLIEELITAIMGLTPVILPQHLFKPVNHDAQGEQGAPARTRQFRLSLTGGVESLALGALRQYRDRVPIDLEIRYPIGERGKWAALDDHALIRAKLLCDGGRPDPAILPSGCALRYASSDGPAFNELEDHMIATISILAILEHER
jgi:hypothetical protein